jgi:hypothetical protein
MDKTQSIIPVEHRPPQIKLENICFGSTHELDFLNNSIYQLYFPFQIHSHRLRSSVCSRRSKENGENFAITSQLRVVILGCIFHPTHFRFCFVFCLNYINNWNLDFSLYRSLYLSYHLSQSTSPVLWFFFFFEIGSLELFAWAGFEPWFFYLCLLSS